MILVDANLLVYAHVRDMAQHERARDWLDRQLNQRPRVGLPWPSLVGFLRLVSNPRVFERPEPIERAFRQVTDWLDCDSAWIPVPTARHRDVLARTLEQAGAGGNLVPDAHLAAFHLSPAIGSVSISTRIKMKRTTWVRALAKTSDDEIWAAYARVQVMLNGCG